MKLHAPLPPDLNRNKDRVGRIGAQRAFREIGALGGGLRFRSSVGVDGLAASGAKVRSSKHELETVHERD
jgi:hypothetical protein